MGNSFTRYQIVMFFRDAACIYCSFCLIKNVFKLKFLFLTFFLLDQKEPKNQDKPDRLRAFCQPCAPGWIPCKWL